MNNDVMVMVHGSCGSGVNCVMGHTLWLSCGAVVRHRTGDRKVAGSTPGRGAIKSTRSTQPSIPPSGVGKSSTSQAGVRRGAFTYVGWQVTLCDPIWQVMSRSSEMGFP